MGGRWLEAIPCAQLGTMLDNQTFRIASSLRLGLPISEPYSCAKCGLRVNATAEHGLQCSSRGHFIPRHDAINNIISRALKSAYISHTLEPTHLHPDNRMRP